MIESIFQRKGSGSREQKDSYLIFCEGESEMEYFKSLGRDIVSMIDIKLHKLNNSSLVSVAREIISKVDRFKGTWKIFDKVFCVFDKNKLSYEDFCEGQKKLKQKKIELIYSNKSFEVWILMHYSRFNRSVQREEEYSWLIQKHLPWIVKPYHGLYEKTKSLLEKAIINSKEVNKQNLKERKDKYYCEPYTDLGDLMELLFLKSNTVSK